MIEVGARPLDWKEEKTAGSHGWSDTRMGFWIDHDADDDSGAAYTAGWGEGDSETFPTLEEAKQWCQDQAGAFIRDNVYVKYVAV